MTKPDIRSLTQLNTKTGTHVQVDDNRDEVTVFYHAAPVFYVTGYNEIIIINRSKRFTSVHIQRINQCFDLLHQPYHVFKRNNSLYLVRFSSESVEEWNSDFLELSLLDF